MALMVAEDKPVLQNKLMRQALLNEANYELKHGAEP
jgi:hypothetical protein